MIERNDEAMLRRLLSELAEGRESAPDLTDSVMSRLGFVRCTQTERRRADRIASYRRAAVMLLMLVAAAVGYFVASSREEPNDGAIVPALGGALERHGRSFQGVLSGMPRWREPVSAVPASLRVPSPSFGAVPVLFIPVHSEGCGGHRRFMIDDEGRDCPNMRRMAAQTPFPEA